MIVTAPRPKQMPLIANDPRKHSLLMAWPSVRSHFPYVTDFALKSWRIDCQFPWCFNLGVGKRRFIFVLTESVLRQKEALTGEKLPPSKILTWDDAINAALPPKQVFKSPELHKAWNITPDQFDLLLRNGSRALPFIQKKYQPREPRSILRLSAQWFLKKRAIMEDDDE